MKKLLVLGLVLGLGSLGCGPTSTSGPTKLPGTGGTPKKVDTGKTGSTAHTGSTAATKKTIPDEPPPPAKPGSVSLKGDTITVKQGEKKTATIKFERKDYKGDVSIKAEPPVASGLTVKVKGGEESADVEVEAAKDAKVGEVEIPVTGTGKDIKAAEATIKVKVEK